ncbi:fibronectin type III domain-containing protein [Dactylosporangium roseum]|uniref:Fibronectin type III domain-containing protein n=1 Tax=Dactylosporangium roseum TaxID=47989 RepID=A0ABY5YY93_9ACTN|nr:fibronectin type III domain-containing protein [Dactylosporangium roseum]UWZ33543.1 fibronectin type III domain-containing protein [Dactylosporangium roseum]
MTSRVEPRVRAGVTRAGVSLALAALCGPALAVTAIAGPAYAATLAVTTPQDTDDLGACADPAITTGTGADGELSLREALCRARNAGTGTVTVPAGTYVLSLGALVVDGGAGPVDVTVTGAGAGSTIVDGAAADRVFDLDPSESGGVHVTMSGLTVRNGRPADGYGGGGILAGAPDAGSPDTLTLSDCRITGNVNDAATARTNAPGGGVAMAGGSLTVDNCVISGNSAGSSAGGGVYFSAQHATDDLRIDDSVFDGNTMANTSATGPGAAPNGGAGLAMRADIPGGTMSVSDTTFDGNTATGSGTGADARGGAVYVHSGAPVVTRSVFTGNSVSGSGGAQALGGALYVAGAATVTGSRITGNSGGAVHHAGGGTLTATRNWWGCNAGPGNAGCDTTTGDGTLTTAPHLRLTVAVEPASVVDGATATATAGFRTDSAGADVPAAQLGAVAGLPVTWSATGGTLSAEQGTIQAGQGTATATYTATAVGAGSVRAVVDGQEQTGPVDVTTPQTPPTPPDAPAIGAGAVHGPGSVEVGWTPPAGAVDSYRVYVSDGGPYTAVGAGTCASAPATGPCTVTGLTPGVEYTFTVSAVAGGLEGPRSAPTAPVTAITTPAAPGAPTATVNGDRSVRLAWTPPAPPVTGYRVEAATGDGPFTAVTDGDCAAAAAPECTITGLTAGTSYRFRVTARNAAGDGAASAPSAAVVAVAAPDAPVIGTVTVTGDRTVTVPWTAPSGGADAYRVAVATGGPYSPVTAGTCASAPATGPCTVTGLTAGTRYTFTVTAIRGGVEGATSGPSNAVTALATPGAPVVGGATPADRSAVVTWSAPDPAAGVTGYTATARPGGQSCEATGAGATTCTITGLANGTAYSVTVTAHSPAGDSAAGGPAAVTPGVAPGAPTGVTAVAGVASIKVSWTAPAPGSGIAGYLVTETPGPATCTTGSATDTGCVLGAEGGTTYTVTVVAKGVHGGDSAPSQPSAAVRPTTPEPPATPPDTDLTLITDQGPISSVAPGQSLVVSGTGFAPHSTVTITVYSDPAVLATVTTDGAGNFSTPVTVPGGLPTGQHTFVALGVDPAGVPHSLKLALTVPAANTPPATVPGGDTLPVTGTGVALMVVAGLSLMVTGAALRSAGRSPDGRVVLSAPAAPVSFTAVPAGGPGAAAPEQP